MAVCWYNKVLMTFMKFSCVFNININQVQTPIVVYLTMSLILTLRTSIIMEFIIIWLSAQRLLVCTNGCMKTVYLELHNDDIYYYDNQFFIMLLTSYFYGFVKLCMHVCTKQNYNVISKNQNIAAHFIISMISKLNSHQTFVC